VLIRALGPADGDACDAIMRGLPEWFGLEHGLVECSRAVREDGGFAVLQDGAVAGFATLRRTTDAALEITWLAVERARHGHGLGRALVEAAAARADAEGSTFLTAWTLAASDADPHYATTRAFYARMGFAAAAEAEIWGPENPAVLLVRSVTHARGPLT
jgi:GNAT superfamily N-acetyltransferase